MDPFPCLCNRLIDLRAAVRGVMFPVRDQRRDDCGGTFRVTIFDHDPAEDFGGVDPFHPFPRALELVRGESPVRVL